MKRQIRRGIWETNSSSTHSITLHNIKSNFSAICNDLGVEYSTFSDDSDIEFFDGTNYILHIIPMCNGHEETIDMIKIESFAAKLSFFCMVCFDYVFDNPDRFNIPCEMRKFTFDSTQEYKWHEYTYGTIKSGLLADPIGKKAWDICMEKADNKVIVGVDFKAITNDDVPLLCSETGEFDEFKHALDNEETLNKVVDIIFDENNSIVFADIPYSSYCVSPNYKVI